MKLFTEIVSIEGLAEPEPIQNIIVWNLSPDEVIQMAKDNPKAFIFTFLTGDVEDIHDYSKLEYTSLFEWTKRIATPCYVGNMEEPEKVAEQLVTKWTDTSKIWG